MRHLFDDGSVAVYGTIPFQSATCFLLSCAILFTMFIFCSLAALAWLEFGTRKGSGHHVEVARHERVKCIEGSSKPSTHIAPHSHCSTLKAWEGAAWIVDTQFHSVMVLGSVVGMLGTSLETLLKHL